MQEFLMTTYATALTALVSYIVWLLKRETKVRGANSKGTMLLLRGQLKSYHKEYVERGWITSVELEEYMEIYNAYHSLGGNGVATHWKEDVEKLEVRD